MAQLVDDRAQKRLEGDHLPPLGGAHPDRDPRWRAVLLRLVESMQLAVAVDGALGQHPHAYLRHVIARGQRIEQILALALHPRALDGGERALDAQYGRPVILARRNAERGDTIAAAI